MMPTKQQEIQSLPFSVRADLPHTPPLTSYLLHLISIKRSCLCVSADVHSTSALLRLAEEVGDYICVFKTHADIIDDFSERTIKGLNEISRRKQFLLFEDRKFGDIGSMFAPRANGSMPPVHHPINCHPPGTLQSQYTRGPLRIASWAHLTNAHLLPGPSIIAALQSAAITALVALNQSVSTEITTGTPCLSVDGSASEDEDEDDENSLATPPSAFHRKSSVVTAITTISQTYEPTPANIVTLERSLSSGEATSPRDREQALQNLGPPPHARGLLLLAQMSSEGNLMAPAYTSACITAARNNPEFVVGFVSQQTLNSAPRDAFVNFTPGVHFPPDCAQCFEAEDEKAGTRGDGLGQRWRSPREVILKEGADVIIVGRGILTARNRAKEAERYRRAAWEAYEERIGRRNERGRGKQ